MSLISPFSTFKKKKIFTELAGEGQLTVIHQFFKDKFEILGEGMDLTILYYTEQSFLKSFKSSFYSPPNKGDSNASLQDLQRTSPFIHLIKYYHNLGGWTGVMI